MSPQLTDYTSQIRAQIESDVRELKKRLLVEDCAVADELRVGYLVNCHHGRPVFEEGEEIAGLRLTTDRYQMRTITVLGSGHLTIPGYRVIDSREKISTTW